jgi:glycosyltransferase involved in cell wall biosynthesis
MGLLDTRTMPVSGFTVVRNAQLMGYPIVESIRSLLPLCDEVVVGVGQSDDNTRSLIESIGDKKIKIFDAFWDTTKTKGGLILSEKTNEALAKCSYDWCFYLQADEVVHEDDLESIKQSIEKYDSDKRVQGLLFDYLHFYGSFHVIATARNWYRREIRIVRKSSGIQSWNDAQGFRVNGEKPFVCSSGGRVFHYGWVKPPQLMGQKNKLLSRWWHGNRLDQAFDNFEFNNQYGLRPFKLSHPKVMRDLVATQNWKFNPKKPLSNWTIKEANYLASDIFEKVFRFRIGEYKNYRLLR